MNKISIIIPVYNTSKYLQRCIVSILEQTYPSFEVILVNDGSTDNSQKIIDEFVSQYPDKIISVVQANAGQSSARNNGLKYASGDYIFFVDSDDWLEKNALELMYNQINSYNSDIVVCGINFFYTDVPEQSDFIKLLRVNKYLPQKFCWGKLIRLSYWAENNFEFIEGIFYEDLELVPKILFNTSKISIVDTPLYNYELRNQTSTTKTKKKELYIFDIIDSLLNLYKNKKKDALFEQFMLYTIVLTFLEYYDNKANHKKISYIFNNSNSLLTLENARTINQKVIIFLYKIGTPLTFISKIVKFKHKIIKFIR